MVSAPTKSPTDTKSAVISMVLCVLYIGISAGLINFNKFLMSADRCPFAMVLTTVQMAVSTVLSLLLYTCAPSLYPSMEKVRGNERKILSYFVPLAFLFLIGVVASNEAYKYCSVAFLQFMKQFNVPTMFGLSVLTGSQVCDRMKFTVICWIACGVLCAVRGEMNFVWLGFFIQLVSQLGECFRNIAQEWVLSGSDLKLDPLTYTFLMAPMALAVLMVGNLFTWSVEIAHRLALWWPYLILNSFCAFSLNVTIATVIKQASVMTFILSGVVKDILVVTCGAYLHGDSLTVAQIAGFSVATSGIFFWSFMKLQPNHAVVKLFSAVLGFKPEVPWKAAECEPLIEKGSEELKQPADDDDV